MAKPKASYFCENCGSKVPWNSRFCPKCGKFFSSVRCPKCGHTGSAGSFKNGCPACHYATGHADEDEAEYEEEPPRRAKLSSKSKKSIKKAFAAHSNAGAYDFGAPLWLYVSSIIVLFAIIGLIFYRCH